MSEKPEPSDVTDDQQALDWADFLATSPPNVQEVVDGAVDRKVDQFRVRTPNLWLYCSSKHCGGYRWYESNVEPWLNGNSGSTFLQYRCANCKESIVTYAVIVQLEGSLHYAEKYGQVPPLRIIPTKHLDSLLGEELDAFRKGAANEVHGYGIGAFAYYRRVVERQRDRLLAEIVEVAQLLHASNTDIQALERAQGETQFSSSVDAMKDAVPASLLIHGQNPLRLLHKALSKGLHDKSDDDCLRYAVDIRTVLTELSRRLEFELRDKERISEAVKRLTNINSGSSY